MDNDPVAMEDSDPTEPSRTALVQELERIDAQHERPVTATVIRKAGEFSINQHRDVFGNLRYAFEATDINREQQFRPDIARVWKRLGHQPSCADMREHGAVKPNTVEHYLGRWEEVCTELAQRADLPTHNESGTTQSGDPSSNNDDTGGILDTVENDIEQGNR